MVARTAGRDAVELWLWFGSPGESDTLISVERGASSTQDGRAILEGREAGRKDPK